MLRDLLDTADPVDESKGCEFPNPPQPQELLFETAIILMIALGAALAAQLFLAGG